MSVNFYNCKNYNLKLIPQREALNNQLLTAVKNNDSDLVESLLERRANVHMRAPKNETLMDMAARKGHACILTILSNHVLELESQSKITFAGILFSRYQIPPSTTTKAVIDPIEMVCNNFSVLQLDGPNIAPVSKKRKNENS